MERSGLTRFAWLSIGAALATIALKALAYFVTDSVGLLSDALESLVNLAAALMALAMLIVAARPPDEIHAFGYSKAEYFSSGVEGALIVFAAVIIAWTAVPRLITPQPLEQVGTGLAASIIAAALNFLVARHLLSGSKQYRSITLEADAHHLMTDVWTSAGVVAGIAIVALTGWTRLDPMIALCVAVNILLTGVRPRRRSWLGLFDTASGHAGPGRVTGNLVRYASQDLYYHALRTRQAGVRSFISFHALVPGEWSVQRGHVLVERIERDIRAAGPCATDFTFLETINDQAALMALYLERCEAVR